MFRLSVLHSKFAGVILSAFVWFLLAIPAYAACTALPLLSTIVSEVEQLSGQTEQAIVIRSGKSLATKRAGLVKFDLYQRLSAVGYERKLKEIMELKIKLGVLSQIALDGDIARLAAYQRSPDFQRSFDVAKSLVDELCTSRSDVENSDAATDVYGTSDGYRLTSGIGISGQVAAFGLISLTALLLGGVVVASGLRRKKMLQDKRLNKRVPCNIPVLVHVLGETSMQRLVDISRTGVNLENDLELQRDTRISLNFCTQQRTGKVTWSNSHFGGVVFDSPLSAEEMARALKDSLLLKNLTTKSATPIQVSR